MKEIVENQKAKEKWIGIGEVESGKIGLPETLLIGGAFWMWWESDWGRKERIWKDNI